jgi:hypothetical protein
MSARIRLAAVLETSPLLLRTSDQACDAISNGRPEGPGQLVTHAVDH